MWANYLLNDPKLCLIPWIFQSVAYFFVLRKMGLKQWKAIVPFVAEHELSTVLFRKMRAFWRPFTIAVVWKDAYHKAG